MIPEPDNADRMVLGFMERDGSSYEEVEKRLGSLGVFIQGGEELRKSAALQAAFLTTVNCAKRCFLGGVATSLPPDIELRIPWPGKSLNAAVAGLLDGVAQPQVISEKIGIGTRSDESWNVFATGWKAVVAFGPEAKAVPAPEGHDFALGGILAGALAAHHAFVRATNITPTIHWQVDGVSLWRPEISWEAAPDGPQLSSLPDKIWLLGLGHLGQAFAWTLGLLPYESPGKCEVMLQDTDVISLANYGTGVLTSKQDVSVQKTRVVETWLRQRSLRTYICDRMFDKNTRRSDKEPAVAFCGFHDAISRRLIGNAGFELVVEAGLGSQMVDFDQALLHTFPNSQFSPEDVWKEDVVVAPRMGLFEKLGGNAVCGARELAGKAVSTSFVGVTASAFAWAEVLRQYHKGQSLNRQSVNIGSLNEARFDQGIAECPSRVIAIRGFLAVAR